MTDPAFLIAFLNARIAEDAAIADGLHFACRQAGRKPDFTGSGGPAAEMHWERFTSPRTCREADAKRALITYTLQCGADIDNEYGDGHTADEIAAGQCSDHGTAAAMRGLFILAAIYSDHPDYQQEWAA